MTEQEKVGGRRLINSLHGLVNQFYNELFNLHTGSEFHAFVEWCGVMHEHLKISSDLLENGIDPFCSNIHTGKPLPIPQYRIDYLREKMDCIFAGAIRVEKVRGND